MIRQEVVFYIKSTLGKFPLAKIKEQLLSEGVSEDEFKESLRAAKRAKSRERIGRFLISIGALAIFASLVFFLSRKSSPNSPQSGSSQPVFLSS